MLQKLKQFFINLFFPSPNIKIGRYGERIARIFLKNKGFKILNKNWRYKHSEIDVVALDGDILVFIEVRLRNKDALVRGLESISRNKKAVLRRACFAYIKKYAPKVSTYRFDVIDIEHDYKNNDDKIYHFENIKIF